MDDLFLAIGHRFGRVELRRRMRDYIRGLLAPVARKNTWQLAEQAGHPTPDGLQHLLAGSKWESDDIRDDLQEYVADKLGETGGVLIVDDTGFIKKGTTSAGVQRQYSGTAGRTENCQIGVFAAYTSARGRALVDRELYLPKSWTEDRERCRTAKVPDEREFATKGELARHMVLRALASPLPVTWVTADSAYGQDNRFRRLLEQSGVGYVLAVPKSQFSVGCSRIEGLFAQAPDEAWEKISCGDGAKGPRVYHWAAVRLPAVAEFDYQGEVPHRMRWALARRSISKSDEIAYYLAYAPLQVTVQELVRVAGARWAIEECFQAAKNECGLDQYEVRRYTGWYRHITLAMLAHAFLAATAHQPWERGAEPVRHPGPWLTVAEVRRLLAACRARPPHLSGHRGLHHALSWSNWRRRRQAVARRCHYLRRCRTIEGRSP
ncbi:IS701 family transposase [Streptomyces dengpaensis]|uniref:IS701 family transposase n=1 Tax=Streptomyces dengpaensis TaxID=2049881 RepID=A0ABM6T1T2_9ACTN|nr:MULTISPECIES: IS701 family transposase [Streptomyces]AVH61041.1 IS701 family transposase [Streptomyces dengpaensis]